MKIKQLFHQSVRGTHMFRALVDLYGLRLAIQEVNKLVNNNNISADYRPTGLCSDLCVWISTPQGHRFWADVCYGRR